MEFNSGFKGLIHIPTNSVQHRPYGQAASRSVQPVTRFSCTLRSVAMFTTTCHCSRPPLPPPKLCFLKVHTNFLQQFMPRSSERSLQVFQSKPHTNLTPFLCSIHVPPILSPQTVPHNKQHTIKPLTQFLHFLLISQEPVLRHPQLNLVIL